MRTPYRELWVVSCVNVCAHSVCMQSSARQDGTVRMRECMQGDLPRSSSQLLIGLVTKSSWSSPLLPPLLARFIV